MLNSRFFGMLIRTSLCFSKGKSVIAPLVFIFLSTTPAIAAGFRVQPTSLTLKSAEKSGAFSVINAQNSKANFQVSVKEWTQDVNGKDVYEEAKDVVFFPKIMTIEPGEQRAIRIGFKDRTSPDEKTYRLFVHQMPSADKTPGSKTRGKTSAGLTILFEYAIPIFLKPERIEEGGVIEKIEMSRGEVKAFVKNSGNTHLRLLTVKFNGKTADGKELFMQNAGGWYILHGKSRSYSVSVPQEICVKLAVIEVVGKSENFSINRTMNVQKKMCTQ